MARKCTSFHVITLALILLASHAACYYIQNDESQPQQTNDYNNNNYSPDTYEPNGLETDVDQPSDVPTNHAKLTDKQQHHQEQQTLILQQQQALKKHSNYHQKRVYKSVSSVTPAVSGIATVVYNQQPPVKIPEPLYTVPDFKDYEISSTGHISRSDNTGAGIDDVNIFDYAENGYDVTEDNNERMRKRRAKPDSMLLETVTEEFDDIDDDEDDDDDGVDDDDDEESYIKRSMKRDTNAILHQNERMRKRRAKPDIMMLETITEEFDDIDDDEDDDDDDDEESYIKRIMKRDTNAILHQNERMRKRRAKPAIRMLETITEEFDDIDDDEDDDDDDDEESYIKRIMKRDTNAILHQNGDKTEGTGNGELQHNTEDKPNTETTKVEKSANVEALSERLRRNVYKQIDVDQNSGYTAWTNWGQSQTEFGTSGQWRTRKCLDKTHCHSGDTEFRPFMTNPRFVHQNFDARHMPSTL